MTRIRLNRLNHYHMKAKKVLIFLITATLMLAAGYQLDTHGYFQPIRKALQADSVPSSLLDNGTMGKVLHSLGSFSPKHNDESRYPVKTSSEGIDEEIIFQKKRNTGEIVYQVKEAAPLPQPALFKDKSQYKPGWPILAITVAERSLYDEKTGILANPDKHGREWERRASIALWDNGRQLFSSAAGLRIHGGKRRTSKSFNSFRIYFREGYEIPSMPAHLLFPESTSLPSLQTIVLHTTDWPKNQPFNNPLAYDIAREIGCLAPETRLVEINLNGQSLGMGFVTEHLSKRQWGPRFQGRKFNYYKFRGKITEKDRAMYTDYFWATANHPDPLTPAIVKETIDLDNFSRHVFSWAWSGTTDYCQGVAVLDREVPGSRLFWINWDMDQSFYDYTALTHGYQRPNWQQAGMGIINRNSHICGRTMLFSRLFRESPEYRSYITQMVTELLNHRISKDFLQQRIQYYEQMLRAFGEPHDEYIAMLQDFMANRNNFILEELKQMSNHEGPFSLVLLSPKTVPVLVDGYLKKNSYTGSYFGGQTVTLSLPEGVDSAVRYQWEVNGTRHQSSQITLTITDNTTIHLVPSELSSSKPAYRSYRDDA